jgi:hypothetical protein
MLSVMPFRGRLRCGSGLYGTHRNMPHEIANELFDCKRQACHPGDNAHACGSRFNEQKCPDNRLVK